MCTCVCARFYISLLLYNCLKSVEIFLLIIFLFLRFFSFRLILEIYFPIFFLPVLSTTLVIFRDLVSFQYEQVLLSPSYYFHTQPHTVNTPMGECMSTCRWVAGYKDKFVLVLCIKWDSLVSAEVIFQCLSTKVYYFTFPVVFT